MDTTRNWPALSVLVVEDNDAAQSLAELLTLYGYAVRVADRGEAAVRMAAADPPDVALLDVQMLGMDGWEVARRLSDTGAGRRPFLVAVTGFGGDEDHRRSADAGIDLHLVKPVDPAVLVGVLERFRRVIAPTIPARPVAGEPHHGFPGSWDGAGSATLQGASR